MHKICNELLSNFLIQNIHTQGYILYAWENSRATKNYDQLETPNFPSFDTSKWNIIKKLSSSLKTFYRITVTLKLRIKHCILLLSILSLLIYSRVFFFIDYLAWKSLNEHQIFFWVIKILNDSNIIFASKI